MAEHSFLKVSDTAYRCIVCRTVVEVLPGSDAPEPCVTCEAIVRRPTTEEAQRPTDDAPPAGA